MSDETKCPKCGGKILFGYGLAGGGIGPYRYCDTDDCDYFDKTQDAEGDDGPWNYPGGGTEAGGE